MQQTILNPLKRTILSPLLVLTGIIGLCTVMAQTSLFDPLIRFIHTGVISPFEALLCILFTIAGFAAYVYLLNLVCGYFVPRIDTKSKDNGTTKGGLVQ